MIQEDWKIKSRSHRCAGSDHPFKDGDFIQTAIFRVLVDGEAGFERKDFLIDAWNSRGRDEVQPFSSWKSVYEAPAPGEENEVVKKQSAEEQLRSLIEADESHTENTRYLLALMLERKKVLRETDRQALPDGILRIYEHAKSGEVFLVKDPQLSLAEIEILRGEAEKLGNNRGEGKSGSDD